MTRTQRALTSTAYRPSVAWREVLDAQDHKIKGLQAELAAELASWPVGTWSEDEATRLEEKRLESSKLFGKQDRASGDRYYALREEQRILDRLAFAEGQRKAWRKKAGYRD